MKRYADTFFRYWLIVLLPIIALPAVEFYMLRHAPKTYSASTNVLVEQSMSGTVGYNSQWMTPAQNLAAKLNEWLQSSSFDLSVAQHSPLFAQALSTAPNPADIAASDLLTNFQVYAKGNTLVGLSYSSTNWVQCEQVINAFLAVARTHAQDLKAQQDKLGVQYYTYQVRDTQQREQASAARLSDYMSAHGITVDQLTSQMESDPTLANLYQQNRADQSALTTAQQTLSTYLNQSTVPSSFDNSAGFTVIDQISLVQISSTKKQLTGLMIPLVIGLVLGLGFLVLVTAMDRTLRFADEVPDVLGLPVLAVLPYSYSLAMQGQPQPSGAARASKRGTVGRIG